MRKHGKSICTKNLLTLSFFPIPCGQGPWGFMGARGFRGAPGQPATGRMGPAGPPGPPAPCADCPYGTWITGHYEATMPEGLQIDGSNVTMSDCLPLSDTCKELGVADNLCGECIATDNGWKLVNDKMGLQFEGKSFDDNRIGKGSIQAQNVCVLAKYGNKGTIIEPATAECFGESDANLNEIPHWFGNCNAGDDSMNTVLQILHVCTWLYSYICV